MSTLIIGALFVVALIALIALVVVVRSGPTSSKVQQSTDNERIIAATPVSTETPTVPIVPTIQQEDTQQNVSSAVPEHHAYVLNGQFRELSIGLYALREQSQEMEQRLSALTMMIEDVERSQKE